MDITETDIIKALWGIIIAMLALIWRWVKGEHNEINKRIMNLESTRADKGDVISLKNTIMTFSQEAASRATEIRSIIETTRKEQRESTARMHDKVDKLTQNIIDLAGNKHP